MAQRESSKTTLSFIDDKTVVLSIGDLASSPSGGGDDFDEESPQAQDLRDSLLMVLRQFAGPKPH